MEWKSIPAKLRKELEDIEIFVRMQVLNPNASIIIPRSDGAEDFMKWLEKWEFYDDEFSYCEEDDGDEE